MRGYSKKSYKGELKSTEAELILFFVSDDDATKESLLRNTKRKVVLNYYYKMRLRQLNEFTGLIEHLKRNKPK